LPRGRAGDDRGKQALNQATVCNDVNCSVVGGPALRTPGPPYRHPTLTPPHPPLPDLCSPPANGPPPTPPPPLRTPFPTHRTHAPHCISLRYCSHLPRYSLSDTATMRHTTVHHLMLTDEHWTILLLVGPSGMTRKPRPSAFRTFCSARRTLRAFSTSTLPTRDSSSLALAV